MYDFEFLRPSTLAEAIEALSNGDTQALAGGQTLIPTLKARLAMPEALVSLTGIAELSGICQDGSDLVIGATTTHAEIAKSDSVFSALAGLAAGIGDPAVRNRGTIGGSVANNDPSACYPAAVLACGATIATATREIAAEDYFDGLFSTSLEEGELITSVRFPVPDAAAYVKFDQPASRFALVGVFVADFGGDLRVAVTGAGQDGVFRWTAAETALAADRSGDALKDLRPEADDMIGDVHGTPEYRAHLTSVMTRRAVAALAA